MTIAGHNDLQRNAARVPGRKPPVIPGVVLEQPASASELVRVQALGDTSGRYLGEATWPTPAGKELPEAGDECTIAIDNRGVPSIVAWAIPGWPGGVTPDRETLAIAGVVGANEWPGFFVKIPDGVTLTLIGAMYRLLGGTSIKATVQVNQVPIAEYTGLDVTPVVAETTDSVELADGDYINWVTSTPVGAPASPSITLFLQ